MYMFKIIFEIFNMICNVLQLIDNIYIKINKFIKIMFLKSFHLIFIN